ncbi:MAG: cell division protein FtsA [Bryobacteraceae bacterium]
MAEVTYAVGLDAGSKHTRCLIGTVEDSCLRLLGFGEAESAGWTKGRIADPAALSAAVARAVVEAEKTAGVSAEAAVVGIGGTSVEGLNNRGLYEMGRPRQIEEVDLRYAVERACGVQLPADRMVLQLFPQDFAVDGRADYRNPKGTVGSRLESFVHVITASTQEHEALVGAVNQAHVAVEETVYEPVAAAYAAVRPEERTEGVALADIGAHSTDLVVYDGDALVHVAGLPISGDHFTRDVSFGFCVAYDEAERIKEECGCAILGLTGDNSIIEVPSPEGRAPREALRRELNLILEARAEELFLYIRRELARANMEQALTEGIVLSGGGARLTGMCDMAERVLNCQARNGLATGILDWPEELDTPAWTVAAGLMMYSARLKHRTESDRRGGGFLSRFFR